MNLSKDFLNAINNISDAALKYAGSAILPSVDNIRLELHKLLGGASESGVLPSPSPANDSNISTDDAGGKA